MPMSEPGGRIVIMYRFLLFVVGLLTCGAVHAQQYDETKLLGTWEVVDLNGPMSLQYDSFKSIILGDYLKYRPADSYYNPEDIDIISSGCAFGVIGLDYTSEKRETVLYVQDFFISNGNKLHIQFTISVMDDDSSSLRFIITDFTDNEIKLTTYDGKTSFSLRRDQESGAKSIKTEESSTGKEYYNLNGVRIGSPEPGIVISKENNEVRKRMFK